MPLSLSEENYPNNLKEIIGHGVSKLVDYQDNDYASLYLERINSIFELDTHPSYKLTEEIAQRLALWMSFEISDSNPGKYQDPFIFCPINTLGRNLTFFFV